EHPWSILHYCNSKMDNFAFPMRCGPRSQLTMREITHFIDGASVAGTSGRFGDVFNPNTGEVQARVALASAAELDAAVASAVRAQQVWALVNPQRRARVMFDFKRLVEGNMNELAEMLSSEHGKVIADSKGDIQRGL